MRTGLKYQDTHKRCPPNIVAIEYRLHEKCGMLLDSVYGDHDAASDGLPGDCRTESNRFTAKRADVVPEKKDDEPSDGPTSSSS